MKFFKKFTSGWFSRKIQRDHWLYVKCDHCGELIKVRVDKYSELSYQDKPAGKREVYYSRKVIIGSTGCFKSIVAELAFDRNRKLIDKKIQGGNFITQKDYDDVSED